MTIYNTSHIILLSRQISFSQYILNIISNNISCCNIQSTKKLQIRTTTTTTTTIIVIIIYINNNYYNNNYYYYYNNNHDDDDDNANQCSK